MKITVACSSGKHCGWMRKIIMGVEGMKKVSREAVGEIRMKREKQAKLNTIKLKKDAI
jgi:hypothetical protein